MRHTLSGNRPCVLVLGLLLLALLPARCVRAEEIREIWRSQLGTPWCVAVDSVDGSAWLGMGNSVVHLSLDGEVLSQTSGFWDPLGIAVDPRDQSVWVCDTGNGQLVHLTPEADEIMRKDVGGQPHALSVDSTDGSLWVSVQTEPASDPFIVKTDDILHVSSEGTELSRTEGFSWEESPGDEYVAADPSDGSCLVADTWHYRIVRLNAAGDVVWEHSTSGVGGGQPRAIAVNPTDGSFWVTGAGPDDVSHFSREGVELWNGFTLNHPDSLAVDPRDGSCWVSGQASTTMHLASDGTLLWEAQGLDAIVAVNQSDGSCWAASWLQDVVLHFAADGTLLLRLATPANTGSIAADEADGSCWVELGNRVAHLAPDGTTLHLTGPFDYINDLVCDPSDGSMWMAHGGWVNGHVIHFAQDGEEIWRSEGYRAPNSVSLNLSDGSVWVADQHVNALIHLASTGDELYRGEFLRVSRAAVDSRDGSVWVGYDYDFVHLTEDGSLLSAPDGEYTREIAVDPRDGSVWVTDSNGRRLRHLASDGTLLGEWEVDDTTTLLSTDAAGSISINSMNGTVWVSGPEGQYLTHLTPDGAVIARYPGLAGEVAVSPLDSTVWVSQVWEAQVVHLRVPWFADLPLDHWAEDAIGACALAGVVGGFPDATYQPALAVTRDQMAVYLARALAGGEARVPECTDTPTFPDVEAQHWALDHIEYMVDQNVVTGYDDGLYHPGYEVTRDQMAVYIARSIVTPTGEAGLADYIPSSPRDFPDVPPSFWAWKHVKYCVENEVVQGYGDGYYHPEIVVTRDQLAVYIARAFGLET